MSKERVSHMESCLSCGLTNSGAIDRNPEYEQLAGVVVDLAVSAGNHKALHDLAIQQLDRVGLFSTCGHKQAGPSSLYALRRLRMASKSISALIEMLEPQANDEHRFD
jgi:hypothetical protein